VPEATALAGFEERFAEIRSVRLRYFVGGSGPPLVLVHGLGGAASNWVELAPILARRHRVILPDLPGHGRSAPLPAAHGLASFADRVVHMEDGALTDGPSTAEKPRGQFLNPRADRPEGLVHS